MTAEDIEEAAAADGIRLAHGEADELLPVVSGLLTAVADARAFPAPAPRAIPAARDPGFVPGEEENPYNSFIRRCDVRAEPRGALAGLRVGVKDNISVAGVPTTNGSSLSPFTPSLDAVVVERVLLAGGVICGKLNMDDFGAAGLGETSAFGPARNPVDPRRSAGGSSGGCGSAVRAGEVDLALAVDQGGSGRIPAAFCGVVALKPTHGLVPTFGVTHLGHTIDHVAPTARSVSDTARLLGAIAGADWRDPQCVNARPHEVPDYLEAAHEGVAGLRVGVVAEASSADWCEDAVVEGLERAETALSQAGALVSRVSIRAWTAALSIFLPYIAHLAADSFRTEGEGVGHLGFIDERRMAAFASARRTESDRLAKQLKAWVIADRCARDHGDGAAFGALQNRRLAVRDAINAALRDCDLLLMPTMPMTAPELAEPGTPFAELSTRTSARLCVNTAPLNLSGHPALSVPTGASDAGLPVGTQIVGRHFEEYTVLRAAYVLERALGPWSTE